VRSTLFYIPEKLAGLPVFGAGWLLVAWVLVGIVVAILSSRRPGFQKEIGGYLPLWLIVAGLIVFLLPGMMREIGMSGLRGLPVRGFGVMLLLATVSGVGLAAYRARQMNLDPEVIFSLAFWMFAFGIAGARLFYIIQYWSQFQRDTLWATLRALADVTEGGLVVYGSVIAGVPAGLIYLRMKKLPPLAIADMIAPSMVVGLALGRVGCFLNGCCFGGFCEASPPGMTFPAESPPYRRQEDLGWRSGVWLATATNKDIETMELPAKRMSEGETNDDVPQQVFRVAWLAPDTGASTKLKRGDLITTINGQSPRNLAEAQSLLNVAEVHEVTLLDGTVQRWNSVHPPARSAPVHPAQLYAAIDAGLLALVLWNFFPYRRRDGEVFALLITVHPISRFLLESIRSDEPGQFGTALTISQWLSLGFLVVAAALWWYIERQPRGSVLPFEVEPDERLAHAPAH
jgi:phosphatidylglycerol:prolipoprotein diacylglycerol transferase